MKNLWTAFKQKNPEALLEENVSTLPEAKVNQTHKHC
jgi:hypothetical protein